MKYNNYDITKIYYSGYEIASAYGCGGYKVYEKSIGKFKATYTGGTTYSIPCDESSTELTSGETRPSGYELSAMTTAVIGDCVTSIGGSAFANCSGLTNITIPDTVTSIGSHAFAVCVNLASITIPSGVTVINVSTFESCTGLTSVNIPSGVTHIGNRAFLICRGLTSLNIPDTVRYINQEAFGGCNGLTSLTLPDSVRSLNRAAFSTCTGLTTVTIGSGVTSFAEAAFYNCRSLTSVTINAVNPPAVGRDAFTTDNHNDYPIYVPCGSGNAYKTASGWTEYADRIVENCFTGKFKLTYSDDRIYSGECDSSTELTTGETKPSGYELSAMTSAIIGECITDIGSYSFDGCSGLTSVTLPDSVSSIGGYAFRNCISLRSITLPSGIGGLMANTFNGCSSLTSVTIPDGVSQMWNGVFRNCTGLTSITCLATTPPTLGTNVFGNTNDCPIYVPAASLEAYKSSWTDYTSRLQAIA